MCLAEKFQITLPPKEETDHEWTAFESKAVAHGPKFNQLPTSQIEGDCGFPSSISLAGSTDVSDGINPKSLKHGYKRGEMSGTDDLYSGEHIDLFYGEVKDEKGRVGFVERNNYLDRL